MGSRFEVWLEISFEEFLYSKVLIDFLHNYDTILSDTMCYNSCVTSKFAFI